MSDNKKLDEAAHNLAEEITENPLGQHQTNYDRIVRVFTAGADWMAAEMCAQVESLKQDLKIKEGEIGSAEHRGNTVNYIYDKLECYGKEIDKLVRSRDERQAEHKKEISRMAHIEEGQYQEIAKLEATNARLREVLGIAEKAIEALATSQKEEGMGLLGKCIVVPDALRRIREALADEEKDYV